MLRIWLSIYLALTTLAGPWFCCCMSERVATALLAGTAKSQPQNGSHRKACCHQQLATNSHEHRSPGQRPSRPEHPNRSPCPCQEPASRLVALLFHDGEVIQQLQARSTLFGPVAILASQPIADAFSLTGDSHHLGEAAVLPFLTAEDLRHALHILRC